jgi:hypothetical protein
VLWRRSSSMDLRTIKVLAREDFATSGSPSIACEESVIVIESLKSLGVSNVQLSCRHVTIRCTTYLMIVAVVPIATNGKASVRFGRALKNCYIFIIAFVTMVVSVN